MSLFLPAVLKLFKGKIKSMKSDLSRKRLVKGKTLTSPSTKAKESSDESASSNKKTCADQSDYQSAPSCNVQPASSSKKFHDDKSASSKDAPPFPIGIITSNPASSQCWFHPRRQEDVSLYTKPDQASV